MEKTNLLEISVNGVVYVPKMSIIAKNDDGLEYVIVRTFSAGVFAGYLKSRNEQEVIMLSARRLWYWDGAASLSQLAMDGTSKPEKCKFPTPVIKVELLQTIEILSCTDKAKISIEGVPVWKA